MQIILIDNKNRKQAVEQAVRSIKFGRLVIVRADTSYAILGLPHSKRALDELRRIKKGRGNKLYSLFVPRKNDVIDKTPDEYKDLARKLLPGEVSLIVSRKKPALRYIRKPTINAILDGIGEPLTATSANASDMPPARTLDDMRKYFACNRVLILFEGNVPEKLPSTIIDLTQPTPKIMRQGSVTLN